MPNQLKTTFIFDDVQGAKVDKLNKNLTETNALINNLKTDKAAQAFTSLANTGQNSLNRLKNLTKDIEQTLAGPQLAFADKYKSAFTDIESRSQKLTNNLQKLAQMKADKGQFDVISQGALGAEQKVLTLTRKIRDLKKDAADPANAKFGKYYVDGLREAERELDKYQRKLTNLNNQQRNLNTGGGGNSPGFSSSFGRRVFGSNLFNAVNLQETAGSAAVGGAVGGVAGAVVVAAFSAAKNAAGALIAEVRDLSIESVKLAGNFEESTNSLAVFAGGTYNARNELLKLDDVALKTPGLKLEAAEAGYKRLRALNFEASTATNLIRGLGIARSQSGADAGAVDRVITNLTQLTSGSGTAADVRQTIGAIPSLRGTFQRAFGTAQFGEINKLAKSNPDEFIRKFTAELNKAEVAQVGLNIALEKGSDVILQAQRDFGEPILEPLTRDVLSLTNNLNENRNTIKVWGQNFADVYNGISTLISENPLVIDGLLGSARTTASVFTFGAPEAISFIGEKVRKVGEDRRKTEETLFPKGAEGFLGFEFDEAQEKVEKEEKLLKKRQELIELQKRIDTAEIENNLNYSKAIAASRFGGLSLIRENTNLEIDALRQQIAANNNSALSYSGNLSEEDFNAGKGLQIIKQRDLENAKLQNQIAVLQITSQKQIAEELQNTETRVKELGRAYAEVFNGLSLRANQNNPFVQLFSDSRSELQKLKDSIKGLPDDLQQAAIASQQTLNRNRLFETRLDNALSINDLKDTASRFRNVPDIRSEADYIRLFGQSDFLKGNLGASNLNAAATFLANRRFQTEDSASDRLRRQISIINSFTTNDDERAIADRRLLGLAGGMDPSQLNQPEREQVALAAEREAERRARYEMEALQIDRQNLAYQKRIAENGDELLKIAREKGLEGLDNYIRFSLEDRRSTGSSGSDLTVADNYELR